MRKILIVVLLFLCGCEKVSILNTVYISSIGIDFVDGEYIGYFYSPPAKDLGKDTNSDDEATVYKVSDDNLVGLFNHMFNSDPININMFHLKTMILSQNFNDIEVLLDYFRFSSYVSYNFHVFITNDELSEVYKYKSMSNISNLYNFLNSPSLIDYESHGVSKCHFLNFANNYSNKERFNQVPLVKIEKNSIEEDEYQLKIAGYSNLDFIYESSIYKGIDLLCESDKFVSVENNVVLLSNYKIDSKEIDGLFNISISCYKTDVSGELDVEYYINNEIVFYLSKLISNEGNIFFIKQYNYLFNKTLDEKLYKLNINVENL